MASRETPNDDPDFKYADEPAPTDARQRPRKRDARRRGRAAKAGRGGVALVVGGLVLATVVGGAAVFAFLSGRDQPASPTGPAAQPSSPTGQEAAGVIRPGTPVVLDAKGREPGDAGGVTGGNSILLADTPQNYTAYLRLVAAGKGADAARLLQAGMAFYVPTGTRGVVVEQAPAADGGFGPVRVRVEDGPAKGRVGWCPWRLVSVAAPGEPAELKSPSANTVTLTPATGQTILLASSRFTLTEALKDRDLRTKWRKDGSLLELTAPTDVSVVSRDAEYAEVRHAGRVWVVEAKHVPGGK